MLSLLKHVPPSLVGVNPSSDESGIEVNQTMFRGMIGSLLYLPASRPDIMQFVCVCARFQANPKESHLTAVKRILKYLKGTTCFGLWYPSGASPNWIGYSDADYGGCKIDRKSTSGTCHLLGSSLVSWHSKNKLVWLYQLQRLNT